MRLVAFLAFCIITVLGFQYVNTSSDSFLYLFSQDGTGGQWLAMITLAVAMVLGVFSGSLFDQLKEQDRETIDWAELTRGFWSRRKTVMGVLVSPFVFFAVLRLVGDEVNEATDFLLAFQNGFFWEGVFSAGITKGQGSPPTPLEAGTAD